MFLLFAGTCLILHKIKINDNQAAKVTKEVIIVWTRVHRPLRSRSQSTLRKNRKVSTKNKAFLCALGELCGENIILMLVDHV
jgi:hypothetical protein